MEVQAIKTRVFKEGNNVAEFIFETLPSLPNASVLVVSSKIVALSGGRVEKKSQFSSLIKSESDWALKTKYAWLTKKEGLIMANAGIDESNANGKIILSPKNPFEAASSLRKELLKHYKIKKLGVVIADSALLPLRAGVIGHALGYAGFKGVRDYRGKKDIFGRKMQMSRTNSADSIATSATLVMGEGHEQQPLALITDAPVEFIEKTNRKELLIDPKEDIFWPLWKGVKRTKK